MNENDTSELDELEGKVVQFNKYLSSFCSCLQAIGEQLCIQKIDIELLTEEQLMYLKYGLSRNSLVANPYRLLSDRENFKYFIQSIDKAFREIYGFRM